MVEQESGPAVSSLDGSTRHRPPPWPAARRSNATTSRTASNGTSQAFFPTGTHGRRPMTSSTGRSTSSPSSRGRWAAAPRRCCSALTLRDEIGQLEYKVWYFASLWLRPGSARQPDQRQAPAGPDPVRQGGPGVGLVRSRIAAGSARDRAASGWPTMSRSGRLSIRDRRSISPAGARARRQRRAPAVAVEPVLVDAERRLCGAVHRRRQTSDDHAVERVGSDAELRAVPGDSGDQPQSGRSRGGVRSASTAPIGRPSTPTRRCTTRVLQRDWFSLTGARLRARRSMRRCTATISRPRSSKT